MERSTLIDKIVNELKTLEEIKAVVIGGSYATNTQRPDSDIDLGLYYEEKKPLKIENIKMVLTKLKVLQDSIVSHIGDWGVWMNGGVWFIINKQRVDLIYRNLNFVEKTIDECLTGKIKTDYYQQPAFGFYSYIYCAETKYSKILYDPDKLVFKLKQKVSAYPEPLKEKIINTFLWDAQFSLSRSEKSMKRNEIIIIAGCFTRIVNDLIQVLYALNETFFMSEKRYLKDFKKFTTKPKNFLLKSEEILSNLNKDTKSLEISFKKAEELVNSFIELTKSIYKPKYSRNLDEEKH
jgi:predicted nucleotidyltransferase